jgi:hypothetical protein
MKASHRLALEKQQRRLKLSHKQLNKIDREYNDINLIKYLMSLEPASANTGFYGTLAISNITGPGSLAKYIQVKLAFNNVDITSYVTINGGTTQTITVPIGSRLPNPASLLQYKAKFQSGVVEANGSEDIVGFTVVSSTENSLQDENTIDLLIGAGYISGGALTQSVTIATDN